LDRAPRPLEAGPASQIPEATKIQDFMRTVPRERLGDPLNLIAVSDQKPWIAKVRTFCADLI
jgi:hypothetical protein